MSMNPEITVINMFPKELKMYEERLLGQFFKIKPIRSQV